MHTVALVGAGYIAEKAHLPAWRKLRSQVEIVAICDRDLDRAQALAEGLGVPAAYDDVGLMLSELGPDFVDVCTPPEGHADIAVAALMESAHVLVEKPLALTVEDCRRIIEAERLSSRSVGVVHSELFYPPVIEARRRVQDGEIGDIMGMRIFRSTPVDPMVADPSYWASGLPGGAIGETGPHVVYLAQAFVGPIVEVFARGRKMLSDYPWSPYEDYRLELVGEDATASAVVTYTNEHTAAHIDLWGTEGMLRIELQSRVLVNYRRSGRSPGAIGASALREAASITTSVAGSAARLLSGSYESPHYAFVRRFYDSAIAGKQAPVTSEEGLRTAEVMEEIGRQLEIQATGGDERL